MKFPNDSISVHENYAEHLRSSMEKRSPTEGKRREA